MKRKNNAIYVDLENIPASLDLKSLFDELTLKHNASPDEENFFVIKFACGNAASIKKLSKALGEYNFYTRDTPSITANYKNRADLIISLEALETLIIQNPIIDRYVFITSDSDFTVVMETLRKYGKEVFLVTKESVSDKPIFNNSCDEILIMESFLKKPKIEETKPSSVKEKDKDKESPESNSSKRNDKMVESIMKKVIDSLDPDSWLLVSLIGIKFHQMDKSRTIERSSYKTIGNLILKMEKDKLIERKLSDKGHPEVKPILKQ